MPSSFGTVPLSSGPRTEDRTPKHILLECLLAWLFVSAATAILDLAGRGSSFLEANVIAIVAALFLLTPRFALPRRVPDPTPPTSGLPAWRTTLLNTAIICAITAALYLPGRHIWETQLAGRHFEPSWSTLFRPPGHCLNHPGDTPLPASSVQIWESRGITFIRWQTPHQPWRLQVEAQTPLQRLQTGASQPSSSFGDQGRTSRAVQLAFRPLDNRQVTISATIDQEPAAQVVCGAANTSLEGNPVTLPFSLRWLWMLLATHWLLVALPEEFFYRGYLQPRLQRWPWLDRIVFRLAGLQVTRANVLTSMLFGLAHFMVGGNPLRLAVFFPSLLFGALRDRTGTIATPLLFHAFCNILAHISGLQYG
jgi:hypothetical protein